MEEVYEGYARLFILGHILSKSFGVSGVMPNSMNLDLLAQQPLLAETGDIFVYRPSDRGDIMWPLVLPTPEAPRDGPRSTRTRSRAAREAGEERRGAGSGASSDGW